MTAIAAPTATGPPGRMSGHDQRPPKARGPKLAPRAPRAAAPVPARLRATRSTSPRGRRRGLQRRRLPWAGARNRPLPPGSLPARPSRHKTNVPAGALTRLAAGAFAGPSSWPHSGRSRPPALSCRLPVTGFFASRVAPLPPARKGMTPGRQPAPTALPENQVSVVAGSKAAPA